MKLETPLRWHRGRLYGPDNLTLSPSQQEEVVRRVNAYDAMQIQIDALTNGFNHAIECVDRAFQVDSRKPPPILPDFLSLGEDKFKGVIKLAAAYKALLAEAEGSRPNG